MSDSYRDVIAWQKGMALVTEVYELTKTFPSTEIFNLTEQLLRAVISVPNHIAEGKGRKTKKDYVQFCYRARGSLLEVQTQLETARNLKFLTNDAFQIVFDHACETDRVLNGLIASIEQQIGSPRELRAKS